MSTSDFTSAGRTRRLFLDADLRAGATLALDRAQLHYVRDVVRLRNGDRVKVFNGRDGEWAGVLAFDRRCGRLVLEARLREQDRPGDLSLLFAPLKHARLDYMVQKASELGTARLMPVMTARTAVSRVNRDRMRANAIEAAEQCGLLWVPQIEEPVALSTLLETWDGRRTLIFADEAAGLDADYRRIADLAGKPMALLVGPEGGFEPQERSAIARVPGAVAISLGPRILRADTAAVAGLALVQALAGDWTLA